MDTDNACTEIDPEMFLEWPVTIVKSTHEVIVFRDRSGAEIEIKPSESKLIFERIW